MRLPAILLAALSAVGWTGVASGQAYPAKPVRLVAAFPPGTGVDVAARIVGQKMAEALAQQVIVDNRAGAGGNIAAEFVARSGADGHTLLFTNNALTINPALYQKLPYDSVRDFAPISLAGTSAMLLVSHPSVPARNVKELISLAKARPGQINLASAGSGSPSHLGGALFKHMAGIDVVHVPYKGGPAALTDLIAGQVELYVSGLPPALPLARAGRVRPLGVTTARRSSAAPDIPTLAEAGLSGYDVTLWYGLLAPAGVPQAVLTRINTAVVKGLAASDGKEKFLAQGVDPTTSSSAEFAALIREELGKWSKLIKAAGIKAD